MNIMSISGLETLWNQKKKLSSCYGSEVPSKKLICMMLEICKCKLLMKERLETRVFEVTSKMTMKTGVKKTNEKPVRREP